MDPYVALARLAVEHQVRHHAPLMEVPDWILVALDGLQAGVFVSLHSLRSHDLRGCIGTLAPTRKSVVQEVIHNAIAACARDSRFSPVQPEELADLDIRVDVLDAPEAIPDRSGLDPRRFGVIVEAPDGRRGLLLPDLDGVDTVDQQVTIACRKAWIDPSRDAFSLQRFTVSRHAG